MGWMDDTAHIAQPCDDVRYLKKKSAFRSPLRIQKIPRRIRIETDAAQAVEFMVGIRLENIWIFFIHRHRRIVRHIQFAKIFNVHL